MTRTILETILIALAAVVVAWVLLRVLRWRPSTTFLTWFTAERPIRRLYEMVAEDPCHHPFTEMTGDRLTEHVRAHHPEIAGIAANRLRSEHAAEHGWQIL